MRRAIALFITALFSLGSNCSCGSTQSAATGAARIEALEGVDTSELTDTEKRRWVSLVNDQLSPCGEPVSVARCVSESRACAQCKPAARYLLRLVKEGFEPREIEAMFELRYSSRTRMTPNAGDSPGRGAQHAELTIVEFSDYQCPYCGVAEPHIAAVMEQFGTRVRFVFKNFPLDMHPRARPSARAAVAAGRQDRFWEMHDLLFAHQDAQSDEDFDRYAVQLGLDLERFHADLESAEVEAIIDADIAEGERLGVDSTPTFIIGNRLYAEKPASLVAYLHEELDP